MATPAQITANRANSEGSTGPITAQGKLTCRYNATRHGLTGAQVVVKGEDPAEYDLLRAALVAEHAPACEQEAMLVEEIAQNWWRLQRARRTEAQIIDKFGTLECMLDPEASRAFKMITRYLNSIERGWRKACAELEKIQKQRTEEEQDRAAAASFVERLHSGGIGSVSQSFPSGPSALTSESPVFPCLSPRVARANNA